MRLSEALNSVREMAKRILEELKDAVVVGNLKRAKKLANQIVYNGIPVKKAVDKLIEAMKIVDERYERKEYFVIDVASSASAMREAFRLLQPYLEVDKSMAKGKVIIGSLKGNVQSIGKDIVAATLQAAGLQVVNLGVDIPPENFVETAIREKAEVIAISVSMEETIPYLKEVTDLLEEKQRSDIKVVIGGNAVSEQVRLDYGLDAYAADAQDCKKKVEALLG